MHIGKAAQGGEWTAPSF